MLCAITDGCNTDTHRCDMFNGMIENVISPLFPARKHISKERKYTQIISPLTLGMIKNVNPWSMLLIISLNIETLTHGMANVI